METAGNMQVCDPVRRFFSGRQSPGLQLEGEVALERREIGGKTLTCLYVNGSNGREEKTVQSKKVWFKITGEGVV